MAERVVKLPGPDHPIAIEPAADQVTVIAQGWIVADTRTALTLRESKYAPVQYIPRSDVDMASLVRSETRSWCPYKGEASYFALPGGPDIAWSYETPHPAVAAIGGAIAFYPDRSDIVSTDAR